MRSEASRSRFSSMGEVIVVNDKASLTSGRCRPGSDLGNGKLPGHLCYMVFDCLYVNGHSLLDRPLEDRQAVLWELQHALQTDVVKLTECFPAEKSARLMKVDGETDSGGILAPQPKDQPL
jgi:ATP-dependent DNA ligase